MVILKKKTLLSNLIDKVWLTFTALNCYLWLEAQSLQRQTHGSLFTFDMLVDTPKTNQHFFFNQ